MGCQSSCWWWRASILEGGHTQITIISNYCKQPYYFYIAIHHLKEKKAAKRLSSPAFRSLCASFNSSSSRAQRPFSAAIRCSKNRQSSSRQKSRRLVMARWRDIPTQFTIFREKWMEIVDCLWLFFGKLYISLGWLWNQFLVHWKLPKLFLSLSISSSKVNLLGSITACRCWPSRAIADANETAAGVAGGVTRTWLHKPRHDMNHEIRNPD